MFDVERSSFKIAFYEAITLGITHYIIMSQELINIGFGNRIAAQRIMAIIAPHSSPVKRLKDDARKEGRLVDATQGRRTRSVIVMDSRHIILSSVNVETISHRFNTLKDQE